MSNSRDLLKLLTEADRRDLHWKPGRAVRRAVADGRRGASIDRSRSDRHGDPLCDTDPRNEKRVSRVINNLARVGVTVITV